MALTSDALDQIEKAFRSSVALALKQPDKTSREQYGHLAQLGKILVESGRGEHANERDETPLSLLAQLAEKSSVAKEIVRQFDARPALLQR